MTHKQYYLLANSTNYSLIVWSILKGGAPEKSECAAMYRSRYPSHLPPFCSQWYRGGLAVLSRNLSRIVADISRLAHEVFKNQVKKPFLCVQPTLKLAFALFRVTHRRSTYLFLAACY